MSEPQGITEEDARGFAAATTCSLEEALEELFDNARRAGATHIDVEVAEEGEQHTIRVQDNGTGLPGPEALTAYGKPGWARPGTPNASGATGKGLARLGSRGYTLTSTDGATWWRTWIGIEQLLGRSRAAREPIEKPARASWRTEVAFRSDATRIQIEQAVHQSGRQMEMPVYSNRGPIAQRNAHDMAMHVSTEHGVEFAIMRYGKDEADPEIHDTLWDGRPIQGRMPCVEVLQRWWDEGRETAVWYGVHTTGGEQSGSRTTRTGGVLQLGDEAATTKLRADAARALYRYLLESGSLERGLLRANDWKQAHDLGIDLPEPKLRLRKWHAERNAAGDTTEPGPRIVLVKADLAPGLSYTLKRALEKTKGTKPVLAWPAPALTGYAAYDAAAELVAVTALVIRNGRPEPLELAGRTGEHDRVDQIWVELTTQEADGTERRTRLATDVALGSRQSGKAAMNDKVVVTRNGTTTLDELADLLENAFATDDASSEQRRRTSDKAQSAARAALQGAGRAAAEELADRVQAAAKALDTEGVLQTHRLEISIGGGETRTAVERVTEHPARG